MKSLQVGSQIVDLLRVQELSDHVRRFQGAYGLLVLIDGSGMVALVIGAYFSVSPNPIGDNI